MQYDSEYNAFVNKVKNNYNENKNPDYCPACRSAYAFNFKGTEQQREESGNHTPALYISDEYAADEVRPGISGKGQNRYHFG